jgi:hypothetical protein
MKVFFLFFFAGKKDMGEQKKTERKERGVMVREILFSAVYCKLLKDLLLNFKI